MLNKIKNWFTWKKRWRIYGWAQLILTVMFYYVGDYHMAYSSSVAALALFGIAECKKEEKE